MASDKKNPIKTVLENSKVQVRQLIDGTGFSVDTAYNILAISGMTWLPELVFNGKINTLQSVAGSGVWLFGFLVAGQVFGLRGITLHSMTYAGGSALGSVVVMLK